ncbi:MAG: hypothetical protein Q9171_004592 [Xanthocarpia ochracea]
MDFDGTDGDGNTGGSVRVTPCQDGSYCCGVGTPANNCCVQGNGVFLGTNGETTDVNPSPTSSRRSAAASSTSSTTLMTSSATLAGATAATSETITSRPTQVAQTIEKSTNNTGAIAGGVVGGLVAAALIIVAGLWFLRRRKGRDTGDTGPWIPYATTKQPPREVNGANKWSELPAPVGHEMPAEAPKSEKNYIHELQ